MLLQRFEISHNLPGVQVKKFLTALKLNPYVFTPFESLYLSRSEFNVDDTTTGLSLIPALFPRSFAVEQLSQEWDNSFTGKFTEIQRVFKFSFLPLGKLSFWNSFLPVHRIIPPPNSAHP